MSSLPDAVQVGDWRVEPELDVIARDGRAVKVEPRAMRVLACLIARAGHVVSVEELLEEAWPDVIVGSDSVYQAVGLLRRTLGDDRHHPAYIEHVPRKGYRLIAAVGKPAAAQPATLNPLATATDGTPAAAPAARPAPAGNRAIWAAFAVAIATLGAAYLILRSAAPPPPAARDGAAGVLPATAPALPSIAVLPFVDMSEKRDLGYLADGLTEELIDLLARGAQLRVPARTSSSYFRDKNAPVAEIARALKVDHLLEGSVRRSGNRLRVTAQLIRADSGYHLWSQTYDTDITETFALEDQIAQAVNRTLQAKLIAAGPASQVGAEDAGAHTLRLQCLFFVQRNTAADAAKSVDCYRQLLGIRPQDARAWAGYADALWRLHRVADLSAAEDRTTIAAACEAAEHALRLDPAAAAAHAVLATYHESIERDWSKADAELKAALTADPEDPASLLAAGQLARYLGELDRAITLLERAEQRDPLNFLPYARLAGIYLYQGRLAEAEAAARRRVDLSPEGLGGYLELGEVLVAAGRPGEALETIGHEPNESSRLLGLALVHVALDRRKDADAELAELQRRYGDADTGIAEIHAFRGEIDQAFATLNHAADSGDPDLLLLKTDRYFARLHADPRYVALLHKLRLPPDPADNVIARR